MPALDLLVGACARHAKALCLSGKFISERAHGADPHTADMLSDEIDAVRMRAIDALQHIGANYPVRQRLALLKPSLRAMALIRLRFCLAFSL